MGAFCYCFLIFFPLNSYFWFRKEKTKECSPSLCKQLPALDWHETLHSPWGSSVFPGASSSVGPGAGSCPQPSWCRRALHGPVRGTSVCSDPGFVFLLVKAAYKSCAWYIPGAQSWSAEAVDAFWQDRVLHSRMGGSPLHVKVKELVSILVRNSGRRRT